ncbi:tyrosine-type recombinase/integrase [Vibrio parahaemolyticus]|uniref:tyrosine-type recombinase/integrase n=1 Tax=Vibrio parahaemolyticus TaxID=670 RepID=UPI0003F57F1A|nr:tyrosine-type recombinase/integrase [Vibrio parahaemolyticus]EHH2454094.1 phage integrase family protein [Vibrio parahaemolyticus]EJE4185986.1 tyrosine-type recombinase/integrase [Vibrio parahaemolyticus]EJE4553963.1 tyrosine-type recombinase/integrase [Vibrio parahaemolyticus]ELI5444853.1 tyrosine-type recombinase/integrase [Vibrio parahaemolyticus]TBT88847.1 site-specific integrase [Vibrio parahaemolyticus]
MYLIQSSNVYKQTELSVSNEICDCTPLRGNIGSLPTLFNQDGSFNHEANSYLFYQKAIKAAKDLSPCAQALQAYYQFLEDKGLVWDAFPPIKRLKPTYLFRSHLLKQIKNGELAHSTASVRMNQIVNYYKWLMHDGYLKIKNEKEAPFKMEFVSVQSTGMLAHISPTFTVETSDLRIKVPKDASSKNIRPLSPLSQESLSILTQYLPNASEELRLQVLISIDTGMRIQEVATLSLNALDTATPLVESEHRYEIVLSPQSTGVQTKYSKQRRVEISSELLTTLNEYRTSERRIKRLNKLNAQLESLPEDKSSLKQETIERLELCERHEPLFVSEQGNPVTAKSIEARWTELRTSIKKTSPSFIHRFHDLRSTYGTYRLNDLLEAGLTPTECMELLMGWMGHRNESTTWKYLRYLQRKEAFKVKFGILDSIMHEALGGEDE